MFSVGHHQNSKYIPIAQAWADHNVRGAECESRYVERCHFRGRAFYSYDTIVVTIHTIGDTKVCLVNSNTYSPSTSNHMGYAEQAAREAGLRIFSVPNIGAGHQGWANEGWRTDEEMHRRNAAHLLNLVYVEIAQLKRRWKKDWPWNSEWHDWRDTLRKQREEFLDYVRLTKCHAEPVDDIVTIIADIEAHRAAKLTVWDDPKEVLKRERAHARKVAKIAFGMIAA